MAHLPVITGMGGISPAGRSAFHYGYRRLIFDSLPASCARQTLLNLAVLMGHIHYNGAAWEDAAEQIIDPDSYLVRHKQTILDATLIRRLESNLFTPAHLRHHSRARLSAAGGREELSFSLGKKHLPEHIPDNWHISQGSDNTVNVNVTGELEILLQDFHQSQVNYAGQLPGGFDPAGLYGSRNHPRGLQMTVYGISDALYSMGIDWEVIRERVAPDHIGVYACSSMSQLDYNGNGGMLQARLLGKKVTSKQLPLGFAEMPADFINAYVLGNVGNTGASLGACATFHYNLAQAVRDIQNGTHRVVIVGGSEAPVQPEIIEAFSAMGAIASDENLRALDGGEMPDYRRPCRPFGNNIGFTLGESAQFIVLCDDALALELGADIYGSVNDVFINADGFKKSIASPGVGNYLTFAKAAAATRTVLGQDSLRNRTFIQAHGTGTPQNRVTESAILADTAKYFGARNWKVSAVKAYLGHSLGVAGADQLAASLGIWQYGILPGILTIDGIAGDVHTDGLEFLLDHRDVGVDAIDTVLLNAKGFGGNNATAAILSPTVTRRMLAKRHGKKMFSHWQAANEQTRENAGKYEEQTNLQPIRPMYYFDHDVRGGDDIRYEKDGISLRGYERKINLDIVNKYADMCG